MIYTIYKSNIYDIITGMKKIILINLTVVIILFIILEFISYLLIKYDAKEYMDNCNMAARKKGANAVLLTQRYGPVRIFNQKDYTDYRKTNIGNKKSPIIFFGCSYMYGSLLKEEETLPYKIYEKTGRTTVNRAIPGGSIINTVYDLKDKNFYNYLKQNNIKNPQYIVYLFINDHFKRISNPYKGTVSHADNVFYEINMIYKFKDGKLIDKTPSKFIVPFYGLYTKKAWHYFYADKFSKETRFERMLKLLKAAKDITDKHFPNSKFVIIDYQDGGHFPMNKDFIKDLRDYGFIVLNAEDLAGHELNSEIWRAEDKEHPSANAVNDVADGLIKTLKL